MGAKFFRTITARLAILLSTLDYEESKQDTVHRNYPNSRFILIQIAYACLHFALKLGSWDDGIHDIMLALYRYTPEGYGHLDVDLMIEELKEAEKAAPITYTVEDENN